MNPSKSEVLSEPGLTDQTDSADISPGVFSSSVFPVTERFMILFFFS